MAQVTNYTIEDGDGLTVLADLTATFQAVRDDNAGPTAPTNPVPGMRWRDTGTSPAVLRVRNAANSGWEEFRASMGVSLTLREAPVIFNSSGTYTPDAEVKAVIIEAQGAGGASPGISVATSDVQVSTGANAGNYIKAFWDSPAAATITIGAGGAAGTGAATPTSGGSTSLIATGVEIIAPGGRAGARSAGSSFFAAVDTIANDPVTASGVTVIESYAGMGGAPSLGSGPGLSGVVAGISGAGGSSKFGTGGRGRGQSGGGNIALFGVAASGKGAGGGGAAVVRVSNNQTVNGGDGTDGVIYIWELV